MCFGSKSSPAPAPPTNIPPFPVDHSEEMVTKTTRPATAEETSKTTGPTSSTAGTTGGTSVGPNVNM